MPIPARLTCGSHPVRGRPHLLAVFAAAPAPPPVSPQRRVDRAARTGRPHRTASTGLLRQPAAAAVVRTVRTRRWERQSTAARRRLTRGTRPTPPPARSGGRRSTHPTHLASPPGVPLTVSTSSCRCSRWLTVPATCWCSGRHRDRATAAGRPRTENAGER